MVLVKLLPGKVLTHADTTQSLHENYIHSSRNIFMGYHKNQEKTLESFEDHWYRSGDLGRIDPDGFLWVTGRLKELLITAGGENIAPVPIENNIIFELSRILSSVIVIGDKRKFLTGLVNNTPFLFLVFEVLIYF